MELILGLRERRRLRRRSRRPAGRGRSLNLGDLLIERGLSGGQIILYLVWSKTSKELRGRLKRVLKLSRKVLDGGRVLSDDIVHLSLKSFKGVIGLKLFYLVHVIDVLADRIHPRRLGGGIVGAAEGSRQGLSLGVRGSVPELLEN